MAGAVVAAFTAAGVAPAIAAPPVAAPGRSALVAAGLAEALPIGPVVLEPGNYPGYRVRHSGFVGRIDPISDSSSADDRADSQFMIRPGLAGPAGVSFEAVNQPGHFLVADGDAVLLRRDEGAAGFAGRATFLPRPGLAGPGMSFVVQADQQLYLRHQGFVLHAQPDDGTELFDQDVTFLTSAQQQTPPAVPAAPAPDAPAPEAPAPEAPAPDVQASDVQASDVPESAPPAPDGPSAAAQVPASVVPPVDGPGGTFTVATYNVSGLPQFLNSAASDRGPATRAIGDRINAYDIVNVQEDLNYHADLYDTSRHQFRTPTSGGAGIGFGSNTVSMKPFNAWRRVDWKDCAKGSGDCIGPKGFQLLEVEVAPGVIVHLYNLHTDAGSDAPDLEARSGNLRQLAQFIAENSAGRAVIVAGDTNTRYTRDGEYISGFAADTGMRDAWVTVLRDGQEPKVGDGLVCDNKNITDPRNCEVVDKILYRSGSGIDLTAAAFSLPHEAFKDGAAMLSDHDPVVVTFRWTGQGDPSAGPVQVDEGVELTPVAAATGAMGSLFRGLKSLFG